MGFIKAIWFNDLCWGEFYIRRIEILNFKNHILIWAFVFLIPSKLAFFKNFENSFHESSGHHLEAACKIAHSLTHSFERFISEVIACLL